MREERDRFEKSYEAAKAEEQNAAKQVEEHKKIVDPINSLSDRAMAEIKSTKDHLFSFLYELNNGHC